MINRISSWARREGPFIFWMVAFNLTYIENFRVDNHGSHIIAATLFYGLSKVFSPVILLDILILCLFGRWDRLCRAVKWFFLSVNACLFVVDLFAIYHYGIPMDRAMLEIALTTNLREGSEFLSMYLLNWRLWAFLFAIILSLILLRFLLSKVSIQRGGLPLLLLAGVLLFTHSAANTSFRKDNPQKAIAVFRLISILSGIHKDLVSFREMESGIPPKVILTRNEADIPDVVFILGESTDRNRMALYGYSLPTTPRLLERSREGGLYTFQDVISPHSHTMLVMEKLFTFYRYGDEGRWFDYPNLFSILRAAGYRTVWLSNQESAILGVVGKFFAGQCDENRFTLIRDHGDDGMVYDGALLPLLDEALASSSKKNFYVLHLMGTHMGYRMRYPKEFTQFSSADEGGFEGITEAQKQVRAEYDNAVLYNDFIVDEIIRRFEKRDAIIIYISDHGEEVYEERDFFGHEEALGSYHMIEIPMLVWMSPGLRRACPDLELRIAANIDRPFMTDDMIHVLLDIMRIETKDYHPERSVIHPDFNVTRPRIYSGRTYEKRSRLED